MRWRCDVERDLPADGGHRRQLVGRHGVDAAAEELHHADDGVAVAHRHGRRSVQAGLRGGLGARKVGVEHHVGDGHRRPRRPDAARQADPGRERHALAHLQEVGERTRARGPRAHAVERPLVAVEVPQRGAFPGERRGDGRQHLGRGVGQGRRLGEQAGNHLDDRDVGAADVGGRGGVGLVHGFPLQTKRLHYTPFLVRRRSRHPRRLWHGGSRSGRPTRARGRRRSRLPACHRLAAPEGRLHHRSDRRRRRRAGPPAQRPRRPDAARHRPAGAERPRGAGRGAAYRDGAPGRDADRRRHARHAAPGDARTGRPLRPQAGGAGPGDRRGEGSAGDLAGDDAPHPGGVGTTRVGRTGGAVLARRRRSDPGVRTAPRRRPARGRPRVDGPGLP